MFFFKKNDKVSERFVAVLGSSPLARFLVYLLQENNIDVVVLNPLSKDGDVKSETHVFKSNYQNQSFSFKTCKYLNKKPECCFLASSFDEYKNDLLALSDEMLRDVKIVNFASFYNHEIIEQMEQIKEVRAYFDGWLSKNKKELFLLGRNSEITICQKEDEGKDIQEMLSNKKIDIKLRKDSSKIFWQKLASTVLGNILRLTYNDDISKILLNSEIRQKVDDLIKEITKKIKDKGCQIDAQKLLTDIYAYPDGFESEYASLKGCMMLSEMVGNADCFNDPKLFEILSEITKKY